VVTNVFLLLQGRSAESVKRYGRTSNDVYEIIPGSQCVYCGNEAEVLDHAYPASREPSLAPEGMLLLVPACHECNGLLGDELHQNMSQRKEYLRRRLKKKYAKILNAPAWSDEEIAALRGKLKPF